MWQHKGTNVLLSTEKQQQCSWVFVAFCPRNFPQHFLQPCTGCEGAHPTRVLLEGIGLFQPGRFSTVQLCPHVSPPAADTTPRLPATHVASFVHWHTVPTDCFLFSYFYLVWRICLFLSIYHPSHSFSAEFSLLLPQFLSGCFFYYYYFGCFFFFLLRNEGCTHIFSLLAPNSSREGSGKLPPSPSGTHCPCSQWLTHGHLAFHMASTISSPEWEGRSSSYPHTVLCPFQGLWMTTDGILKRSGWIMHFWFHSQSETLWVGNKKENFRSMWKCFVWCIRKCWVVISV